MVSIPAARPAALPYREDRAALAAAAAAEVGLSAKLGAAAGELSGGQRRKLSVALAFVGDPSGERSPWAAGGWRPHPPALCCAHPGVTPQPALQPLPSPLDVFLPLWIAMNRVVMD